MWRAFFCLLAVEYALAQEVDRPEDGGALESALDDERGPSTYSARWRVRGWDGLQWYQRGEWQRDNQEVFVLVERDVGESWRDFNAFYYRRTGQMGEVVVGDIRAGFAAGLVFGRGRSGGVPARFSLRDSKRLGYRSTAENGAVRGAVWRHSTKHWQWTVLAGRAALDARLDSLDIAISLPESGLHVSAIERAGRDILAANMAGLRLRRSIRGGHVGGVLQGISFSRRLDLRRGGRTPWGFVGDRLFRASIDAAGMFRGYALGVEMAMERDGHWAGVAQVEKRWPRVRLRFMGRYYPPDLHSFFAAAPGAGSTQNEAGWLAVAEGGRWRLYGDLYRRPQRSYFVPVAAQYASWGGHWRWQNGRLQGRLLWQERFRPRWAGGRLQQERTRRGRFDIEYGPWSLQGQRLWLGRSAKAGEWGSALALRGRWQVPRGRFVAHGSYFATDSYASRLYEYEYDLPGSVSIRPLYGRGWRFYGLAVLGWRAGEVALRYRLERAARTRHYLGLLVELRSQG
jgi:hypothetical protein